ncbi:MAG: hypothetical protein JSV88_17470 [Candidatus Aminicenantes bacterium]|nr:MAG: hypothetical protein JSV88_17470 [Candidatus Aminicenantes bacterium]
MAGENDGHFEFLKKAFSQDGFNVKNFKEDKRLKNLPYVTPKGYMEFEGKIGLLAEHKTSVNSVTGEPKKTYYVEGTHKQMGFLLGLMAEPEVSRMATEFAANIPMSFFRSEELSQTSDSSLFDKLKELFVELIGKAARKDIGADIPEEYQEEMEGIYEGCKEVNPELKGDQQKEKFMQKLWAINFGHDLAMAHIYTGEIFAKKKIPPFLLRVPIMCNAYSIYGDVVEGGKHYFGRDFMFPTGNVYQDTACLIIYKPEAEEGKTFLPIVSQTAPGIFGSMAALNIEGVAIGVDMTPSQLCNPARPGINSLALDRDCMEHCPTIEDVVSHMVKAQRGVSWLYPVADGKSDKTCIVEAGCNIGDEPYPYFKYLPKYYKKKLKDLNEDYILQMREKYGTPTPQKGLIPRWGDYTYPMDYITDFNEKIWNIFYKDPIYKLRRGIFDIIKDLIMLIFSPSVYKLLKIFREELKELFRHVPYDPRQFGEDGYINKTWTDQNCPGSFYFAPQRETLSNVTVVSNHPITPEMRLTAMNEWVALAAASELNGMQWRYDEVNKELLQAIAKAKDPENPQLITEDTAWRIINFLSPEPGYKFPTFRNPKGASWKTRQVHGSVSLFELKERKIKSLFGYYGDEPITITLPNYIEG